jgi:hypothetical protein
MITHVAIIYQGKLYSLPKPNRQPTIKAMSRDNDEPEILPQGQQRFTWTNEDGDEVSHVFPICNEVCSRCEGFGSHLNPSIGNHAYSMEEFYDSFDNEDIEEYFTRGGKFDVQCQECHGNKVVPVVDESKLTAEQKKLYEQYCQHEEDMARMDAEDRHTRWMEDGCPSD